MDYPWSVKLMFASCLFVAIRAEVGRIFQLSSLFFPYSTPQGGEACPQLPGLKRKELSRCVSVQTAAVRHLVQAVPQVCVAQRGREGRRREGGKGEGREGRGREGEWEGK